MKTFFFKADVKKYKHLKQKNIIVANIVLTRRNL